MHKSAGRTKKGLGQRRNRMFPNLYAELLTSAEIDANIASIRTVFARFPRF
jgi:hypothetical protein